MDKCREEFINWRDMFESDYDRKPTSFDAWQARQNEIDVLKAQVEELKAIQQQKGEE